MRTKLIGFLKGKEERADKPVSKTKIEARLNSLWASDLSKKDLEYISLIKENNLSMTSIDNLSATALASQYVIKKNIPGDFMECGVWRGGHSILAALYFLNKRKIFMLDTFTGMTMPASNDKRSLDGTPALVTYESKNELEDGVDWCYASIENVKKNFQILGINAEEHESSLVFLKGKAEEVLKDRETNLPERISVLRLDTDWYESTKVELEVLWDKISIGGIIIIDDYGYWQGCREAVDEYFSDKKILLLPIDCNARLMVKVS
jgi:O-methyltransferase